MNIKEKLIEEMQKPQWFVDTYLSADRINIIALLHSKSDTIPVSDYTTKNSRYLHAGHRGVWTAVDCDETYKDLTQLFNEYLEEYNPNVWMSSVLAAIQLGLKVEMKGLNAYRDEQWLNVRSGNTIMLSLDAKYRINYEAPKLVPDEIWDILDNKFNSIAKDDNGSVWAYYSASPDKRKDYWDSTDEFVRLQGLKFTEDAPMHDVDWEDSLCTRPKK